LLFGLGAGDPLTLVGASTLMGGAALLAAYLPAQRAARASPMVALRAD
jgi:ABC-type antimicrobial peptide transport system permease subunit